MKQHLTLACAVLLGSSAHAQLFITDSLDVSTIAGLLEGIGVTVTNVTVNCPDAAMAQFVGSSEMPIQQGLLLTSGCADCVAGPAIGFASATLGTLGDTDLDMDIAMGVITQDACALEFDCLPVGDTLLFNFAFGSEEYPEYVGSNYNDAFAIYITGPGYPFATNVAAIPGGPVVSINNVNAGLNQAYFYDNELNGGQYVAYDGFTANLTAFAVVQPAEPYHFKVVVSDVADPAFDSGVFLEAFSFRSMNVANNVDEATRPVITAFVNGDQLTLQVPSTTVGTTVTVFDSQGRIALTSALFGERHVVDIAALPTGAYAARVGVHLRVVRFVKE